VRAALESQPPWVFVEVVRQHQPQRRVRGDVTSAVMRKDEPGGARALVVVEDRVEQLATPLRDIQANLDNHDLVPPQRR
jgi:hypothetical protein